MHYTRMVRQGICAMAAFRYGSQWLGLVTHFQYIGELPEKGPRQSGLDGPIGAQLVHSRDGRQWSRCEDRSPVINRRTITARTVFSA